MRDGLLVKQTSVRHNKNVLFLPFCFSVNARGKTEWQKRANIDSSPRAKVTSGQTNDGISRKEGG